MSATVIISKLVWWCTDEDLIALIGSGFGKVVDVTFPRNERNGTHKGYAYIEFDTNAHINNLISKLNNTIYQGQVLFISIISL
jgi:RNA recognition motif-containing protein